MLAWRPDSFWGHYRAAVACFRLKRWSQAAGHLDHCLRRRPDIAASEASLRRASVRWDHSTRRSRSATARSSRHPITPSSTGREPSSGPSRGETGGLVEDLQRFELLEPVAREGVLPERERSGHGRSPSGRGASLPRSPSIWIRAAEPTSRPGPPFGEPRDIDSDELDARVVLAATICWTGASLLGDGSVERRESDGSTSSAPRPRRTPWRSRPPSSTRCSPSTPDTSIARMIRMMDSLEDGRIREAEDDLEQILDHPGLASFLSADPDRFRFLHIGAQRVRPARPGRRRPENRRYVHLDGQSSSGCPGAGRTTTRPPCTAWPPDPIPARSLQPPGSSITPSRPMPGSGNGIRPTRSSIPRGCGSTPRSINSAGASTAD